MLKTELEVLAISLMVLDIWNPCRWFMVRDKKERRSLMLEYKTRGIVAFDRCMNGDLRGLDAGTN